MDAEAIVTVSAAVVALTQIVKWALQQLKMERVWEGFLVGVLALLGVGLWAYSQGQFSRAELWSYFVGWVDVAASAAGVFGFVRAAPGAFALTRFGGGGLEVSPPNQ